MALRTKNPNRQKTEAIESIKNDVKASSAFIFTEYRGLKVEQITELRKKLRENACTYKVVRNNFARIAFEDADIKDVDSWLTGPTALAMIAEDANLAAKTLFEYAKDAPALVIKGAVVDGEIYDAKQIEAFSKLPGKKDLIAMFMSTVNATTSKFVRTLQAIVDKGGAQGAAPAEAKAEAPASEEKAADTPAEQPAESAPEAAPEA
ncbi:MULTISPECIES: 50S ribosomal protein L10 [Treponema]|uniref:Large ribosomal subunit protein uL10 n=2 Tax=Treponemataceae TaxID=2845253 RepID=RL10_TREDE|nr:MULTISPECIES: 50S ribosomal protein L10 [Treponema]Q73JJ5.1 RecName: Full=Large ribosomal subunit protein uL10; AltName: Full=50S ribosomal protein L10 [Treponema denticola ATCC 35405]AAS12941.1 ribosomal protein L10 [Treponema denticola ATCC 35405]EMB26389.1 50S ribosomal protein L10 [Treponema denticola SP37]EMB38072.1 50S ribosomal protein L10 [Treponema denticola ATCC 35404]EMB40076.1 50S ribosomal protein L10 [Treponema denticola ATCC 33521]EPF33875.1 50S ribosomal protein L10 [Trepon